MSASTETRVHSTAIVEHDVRIGPGTSVWDCAHLRHGASIGKDCIIGEKTYVAYDVRIGDRVKINAMVYLCYGVTIEDGVMISAAVTFTNDVFPRATTPDLAQLRDSDPDEQTQQTLVAAGATIGAGAVIGSGIRIGRFAMVGMGSVVTRDVGDFELVVGNPARSVGAVCRCGKPLVKWEVGRHAPAGRYACKSCARQYSLAITGVTEEQA